MTEQSNREDTVEKLLKEAMNMEIPSHVEDRLRRRLTDFRTQLASKGQTRYRRGRYVQSALRLGWVAALALLFLGGGVYYLTSNPAPTWAEVLKRFAGVSSLQATIYVREGALSHPVELEVWMDYGGKLRLRAGNKVAFGDNGRFIEEILIGPPETVPRGMIIAEETVQFLITKMGRLDTFSFEVLLRMFPDDLSHLSTPLRIHEPTISSDLVIFDITSDTSPEWIRVWTLRTSCLPIRVLYWDPRYAQTTDVLLSYGNRQPPEFFDPAAFKERLAEAVAPADKAYALIQDIGKRPVTPSDVAALLKAQEEALTEIPFEQSMPAPQT